MPFLQHIRVALLPAAAIDRALPREGLIYEIGSGYGALGAFLARQSPSRRITCVDLDSRKLEDCRRSFVLDNLRFELADATSYAFQPCSGALLSDFLHHLELSDQERVLAGVARAVEPGGVIVIKEIDRGDGWRRLMSRLWDKLLYPRDAIFYRTRGELVALMSGLGFDVTVERKSAWFPGSTFLYTCRRRD